MKVLDLECAHGHGFEGWFASSEAFESQQSAGQVECPICGDTTIVKRLSAPRINLGRTAPEAVGTTAARSSAGVPNDVAPQARWLHAVRELMAQTENVGERFAEEARKMHYGETEERGIRGQASREQAEALIDEGIAVLPLPGLPALKETLQ